MYCKNYGKMIEDRCNFCPNCSHPIGEGGSETSAEFIGLGGLFEDLEREFKKLEKMFKNISIGEEIRTDNDIPGPHGRKSSGVGIRISSGTGKEPKIDVATFGDYKGHESEIKRRFGVARKPKKTVQRPLPKVVEEPEAEVSRVEDRIILEIKVPDVKSMEDIDIKELQESIEIRAYVNDKAYFTLFTAPQNYRIAGKRFEKGVLIIEIDI